MKKTQESKLKLNRETLHNLEKPLLHAIAGAWALRGHILEQRRQIARYRRHGDLWMLRFFRLGFGRWGEVKKILRAGFPKIH